MNLDDSIDSGNFSVRDYLLLIWKDSATHMHGLAVYVKEQLPFVWDLSLENSADSCLCLRVALLHSGSYFFFLCWSPLSLCMVFNAVSSNIDEILLINPSANVFVFGNWNIHHTECLTYSGRTDRLVNSVIISNGLIQIALRMVNFPTQIPDCYSHSPALLDIFLSSDASIYSTMAFLFIGKFWSCGCVSFHWLFIKLKMGCPTSWHSLWLFLGWLGLSLWSLEICSMGGYC